MGLFILPGRLKRQFDEIEKIMDKEIPYDEVSLNKDDNDLFVHRFMIKDLLKDGYSSTKIDAEKKLISYVNNVCEHIEHCCI